MLINKLQEETSSKIFTKDLFKLAGFVFKNNFSEFNNEIKQQIFGITNGTKFAPPYAGIYMDRTKADFLKLQEL